MEPKPAQFAPAHASVFAARGVAEAYRHRPPYPTAAIALLHELLPSGVPARILDAGCGTGYLARPLAPYAARLDAVDCAPTMVEAGRQEPGGDHPHLHWHVSPLETFAGDPPYALIVAGDSIHWMDWDAVLPRMAGWLAPGGLLALAGVTIAPPPWEAGLRPIIARHSSNHDFQPYTLHTVADELARRGLFRPIGQQRIPPAAFAQPLAGYVESFHARNGLARAWMTAPDAFDQTVRDLVASYCPDGQVRLEVGAVVIWGQPLAPGKSDSTRRR